MLNIVTGSGSGANAITIDASQVVTIPGNLTVSGTLSASGGVSGGIRSGTAVASTSGTSIDFTSLPTGVKRITLMFTGVSTNGSSPPQIQIGAGSITTSGYLCSNSIISASVVSANFTAGFGIGVNTSNWSTAFVFHGSITLSLQTGNTWVCSGVVGLSNQSSTFVTGGSVALGGTLDRLRITTANGTDTYDAGSINILFE
jgi:hypothetical protein